MENSPFEWGKKTVRTFGIRQDMLLKRDLICFVRWLHYIQLQWQRVGSLLFCGVWGGGVLLT